MKKGIVRNIIVFVAVFALCFILKILACSIPTERISNNLNASAVSKDIRNTDFFPWSRADSNRVQFWAELDYLNDCLTLDPSRPVYSALKNPVTYGHDNSDSSGGAARYTALMQGENTSVAEFNIYTWGAITVLRPLLYFMTYDKIIDFTIIIGWMLIFICAYKIFQVSNIHIAFVFVASLLFININVALSLIDTAMVFLIALCGIITLSHTKEQSDEITIFLIIGLLTGFFGWFTVEIVTFAYPAFYVFMKHLNDSKKPKQNAGNKIISNKMGGLVTTIKSSVAWCVGYGGMTVGKVVLDSIYSKRNLIPDLFTHFTNDVSKDMVEHPSNIIEYILVTFKRNFKLVEIVDIMPKPLIVILILVVLIGVCIFTIKFLKSKKMEMIEIFASMFAPFAWLVVFHGHIFVHPYWDYRLFGPSLCAIGTMFYILGIVVKNRVYQKQKAQGIEQSHSDSVNNDRQG